MLLAAHADRDGQKRAFALLVEAYVVELNASVGSDAHFHARLWVAALQWSLGLYDVAPDIEEYERLERERVALRPLPAEQEDMLVDKEDEPL